MERMRDWPKPQTDTIESVLEKRMFIRPERFQNEVGVPIQRFDRYSFSVDKNRFKKVPETRSPERGEVLLQQDNNILVVPPLGPGVLTIEDLAKMTVPVVGFIDKVQPDLVIGCDRGARIYGDAVHSMWGDLKGDQQRFPTMDNKLDFARLSTSLGETITSQALAHIIARNLEAAKRKGHPFTKEQLRLMFIDDWISSGATRRHILASLQALDFELGKNIDVTFAVMCGSGGDATGSKNRKSAFWHDNPEIIGVDYNRDGYPHVVATEESRTVRRKIHRATQKLAAKLK